MTQDEPEQPDDEQDVLLEMGDGGDQAGEREPAEGLGHRLDQDRRVEPNGDHPALVREENPVDAGRDRFVRYDPNDPSLTFEHQIDHEAAKGRSRRC